jgi:hypothetical protein
MHAATSNLAENLKLSRQDTIYQQKVLISFHFVGKVERNPISKNGAAVLFNFLHEVSNLLSQFRPRFRQAEMLEHFLCNNTYIIFLFVSNQ